jgi:putative phosphoribosyl transferase
LTGYTGRDDVLVLGIPRGGVPVALEVAQALHAPLDILLVRKLGTPGQRELAMGAISSGGARVLNRPVIADLGITEPQVADTIALEETELQRRERLYRGVQPAIPVRGRIVILVDDGIATGSSMLAAIEALKTLHPRKIVVATPVAASRAGGQIRCSADEFVCVVELEWFFAIGEFYRSFPQTTDAEVRAMLQRAARPSAAANEADKTRHPATSENQKKRGAA